MNLTIENIATIKSADVKLNGLTVIAGENDTGKSTVGKLMFSIVKAINRHEEDIFGNKVEIVSKQIERLYFFLRSVLNLAILTEIKNEFYPRYFLKQISPFFSNEYSVDIEQIFREKQEILATLPDRTNRAIDILQGIKQTLLEENTKEELIKQAFEKVFHSEFFSELSPKGEVLTSTIRYQEGETQILDIQIDHNTITNFNLYDILYFNDVTFVESPVILQMYDLIRSAETLLEKKSNYGRTKISLHLKDLMNKLENAKYSTNTLFERKTNLFKNISAIINGDFSFDTNKSDFIYSKKEGFQIRPLNTASGIKSFGLIQLLLQANVLDDRSLLVIDEPENHLHPKWQVEYARMIVELVKNEINVLISSHSPYMIQAIKFFSEKSEIKDKTNFYLAENQEIKDVTTDLNQIFIKLAEPLHHLVWK